MTVRTQTVRVHAPVAFTAVAVLCLVISADSRLGAQAPTGQATVAGGPQGAPAQPAGRQGGGRQGGGGGGARGGAPIPFDEHTGYRPIFDGQTLAGWEGDPMFWRVEAGAIVGESTPEKVVAQNTFLIWRGGEPADFDLKLEFRMNATNSGVQYRSQQLPVGGAENIGKWVLKGYQADIDFANQYTGMLYEERGRAFLAPRGTFGYVGANQPPQPARGQAPPAPAPGTPPAGPRGQLAQLENGDALKAYIKQNDWNQFQVIARGNILVHILNGHVTAMFLDDDVTARSMKGLLGFQIHVGAPMKVEFKNVFLKTL